MLRTMTPLETKTVLLLIEAGEQSHWEYSASLETPDGPLLEFSTEMLENQANPSSMLLYCISKFPKFVLHHNHLSGESLSGSDWRGASLYFNEIFAHCNDGTSYYGNVINHKRNLAFLFQTLEVNAQDLLFKHTDNPDIDGFFRKEVINRAFKIKGLVEYEYKWGTLSIPHQKIVNMNIPGIQSVGELGVMYDDAINKAAHNLSNMQW